MGAPWFKVYSKELLSDSKIMRLEDDQFGKLVKLWAFANEDGHIPAAPEDLRKLLHVSLKEMKKHMDWVLRFFVPSPEHPENLISLRLRAEQDAYELKCQTLRENGTKGGRPRKPEGKPDGLPKGSPEAKPDGEPKPKPDKTEVGSGKKEKEVHATRVADASAPPLQAAGGVEVGKPKKPTRVKAPKPLNPEDKTLEEILEGKGSQTWDRFWKTVGAWNRDKIPSPKRVARAWLAACLKADPKLIYLAALHYRDEFLPPIRSADETRFMKSPLEWLEQEAWNVELQAMEQAGAQLLEAANA